MKMSNRKEITGLRAIAVIPVILHHAFPGVMPGGFLGVDVFFVISGFLISGLLFQSIEARTFRFRDFWARRARRLVPALLVVIASTTPIAYFALTPRNYEAFSETLLAVFLLGSNLYFYIFGTGYFDPGAMDNPLLHTWSLAVEEQFYVLFPILLVSLYALGSWRRKTLILATLFVASLAFSVFISALDSNANFFLLPSRAWELLLGALAWLLRPKLESISKTMANWGSFLGLGALILAYATFDDSMGLPGIASLVPTLGSAVILLVGDRAGFIRSALTLRPLIFLGLISYSLYLWHQPVLTIQDALSIGGVSNLERVTAVLLALVLATLTWKFVETPWRAKSEPSHGRVPSFWLMSSASWLLVLSLAAQGMLGKGNNDLWSIEQFPAWRDLSVCNIERGEIPTNVPSLMERCSGSDGRLVILIGDSMAQAVSKPLRSQLDDRGIGLLTLSSPGCFPIPGVVRRGLPVDCHQNMEAYWSLAETMGDEIVLLSRWPLYFNGERFDNLEGGKEKGANPVYIASESGSSAVNLRGLAEQYIDSKLRTKRITVVDTVPPAGWRVPDLRAKIERFSPPELKIDLISTSYEVFKARNEMTRELWSNLASASAQFHLVPTSNIVCGLPEAVDRCLNELTPGASLYRDAIHPSPTFSEMIAIATVEAIEDQRD